MIGTAVYSEVGDWSDLAQIGETLCAIPIVMLVVLGPGFVRADLRQDLLQLDQLRSYPLRGSTIVAAEIASSDDDSHRDAVSAARLAAFLSSFDVRPPVPIAPAVLIALVALPTLNAIALTVANGSALLFPGWVRLGDGRAQGIEAMGQNVLAIFVSLVITFLALIPPLFVATIVASGVSAVSSRAISIWVLRSRSAGWRVGGDRRVVAGEQVARERVCAYGPRADRAAGVMRCALAVARSAR